MSQSQLSNFNSGSPKQHMPHLVYENNRELSQMKGSKINAQKRSKTRVTLNLSKKGLSVSKNLTPNDISLIQEKLEKAK